MKEADGFEAIVPPLWLKRMARRLAKATGMGNQTALGSLFFYFADHHRPGLSPDEVAVRFEIAAGVRVEPAILREVGVGL